MLTIAYCIEIGKEALLPSADKKGIIQSENPADSRRQDFRFVKDRVKVHQTIERARNSTPRFKSVSNTERFLDRADFGRHIRRFQIRAFRAVEYLPCYPFVLDRV